MTLSLGTAYRSFGGEMEASSTPMICRLLDSCRHQLSAIAPCVPMPDGSDSGTATTSTRSPIFMPALRSQEELSLSRNSLEFANLCDGKFAVASIQMYLVLLATQ